MIEQNNAAGNHRIHTQGGFIHSKLCPGSTFVVECDNILKSLLGGCDARAPVEDTSLDIEDDGLRYTNSNQGFPPLVSKLATCVVQHGDVALASLQYRWLMLIMFD